jgi:hypothetical protein
LPVVPAKAGTPGGDGRGAFHPTGPQPSLGRRVVILRLAGPSAAR